MLWLLLIVAGIAMSMMVVFAAQAYLQAVHLRRRVAFLSHMISSEHSEESMLAGAKPERLSRHVLLQSWLRDAPGVAALANLLEQSGLQATVAMLLTLSLLSALGLGLVGLKLLGMPVMVAMFTCLGGSFLPVGYLIWKRSQRAIAFEKQLPAALELIGLYLRSGRSLPQAFIGAIDDLVSPAAEEFTICADEYRLGRPLDMALKRMAAKYPTSVGFRLFAIAVSVLGQTGGNLVEVLERIKKTLEATTQYELRLRAMTGESRMSAIILGILPGIFMLAQSLLSNHYLSLFFQPGIGRILLCLLLLLWGGGIVWIRMLMNSKLL